MARINIDIDEDACALVMLRYQLDSKQAAVNFALRSLASEPMDVDDARRMRGTGWAGDLADPQGPAGVVILNETSASVSRTCRRNGDATVRRLVDCFVAAVVVRAHLELLHAAADLEALARNTPLRLARG